ncbi:MAG TPA: hypothetical protein VMT51_09620 [Dongiaceae bacterium]|nr:hypothetical protein [Dongiaceae bacterium]
MSGPTNGSASPDALDLPAYSLDVQALDLGSDVKAVGLEFLGTQDREPVRGEEAAGFWSEVLPLVAGAEPFALDFFSHLERVRDFCAARQIAFREAGPRCLVIAQPAAEQLRQLFARFAGETFGFRAGAAVTSEDAALASELSARGVDGYQAAYARYLFCAVCELEDGWVTLLSQSLWPSEVIRRVRPAAQQYDVHIARPN